MRYGASPLYTCAVAKSQELAAQVPSDQAIVRRYDEVLAESPLDIKPGEAMLLDRRGRIVGRGVFVRRVFAWKVGIYGALIGGGVLAVSGAWLAGAVLYVAGLTPMLVAKYRGTSTLMAIDVLVRRGQLDEAQRRFDAVPELRRRNPVAWCVLAGNLASHRGDHATALAWWQEAFPRSDGAARELVKLYMVNAFLLSGRLVEARRTFEDVRLPPETDDVVMGHLLTRILFVLCDPSERIAEDELHDWARKALAYSHTGVELASLGWAFERGGDEEMARLLATEALDRMHYPYLATWWPALQHWLDSRERNAESEPLPPP